MVSLQRLIVLITIPSTFFGGHDEKYATPKDQYVWFKDFGLAYNS